MRYVFAIGGNAFDERSINRVSHFVSRLHAKGDEILIAHGNGPQVGALSMLEDKSLAVLTAQTQAEIGLEIQKSLQKNRSNAKVAIVLTRVLVDQRDSEFSRPTKPIGRFYNKKEAERMQRRGHIMKKLIGGYRRVVPSPKPIKILETDMISSLLSKGYVVIAAGGGGIAITRKGKKIEYANAIIDKDRASSLLTANLNADKLIILTNVDGAYLNFRKRGERLIKRIDYKSLYGCLKGNQFEEGSMKPKIEACIRFVKQTGKVAAIGNLSSPEDAFALRSTVITI